MLGLSSLQTMLFQALCPWQTGQAEFPAQAPQCHDTAQFALHRPSHVLATQPQDPSSHRRCQSAAGSSLRLRPAPVPVPDPTAPAHSPARPPGPVQPG
ncbi:hypothetical protein KEM55_005763 [Ascosphaera atra]|nr:hypothetical protein KEM55_005763 [Ascosphaera atra]